MSGIMSGIGLISGLPTNELINSLIQAQSQPKKLLAARIANVQSQRTGLLDLNARLLNLKSITTRLTESDFFERYTANSSHENVLGARAQDGAVPGVINLAVRSLVTSHQMVSAGFADADSTPVGAGQLSLEIGEGRLNPPTRLGDLNGGAGVRRGRIEITDRAGNKTQIDLSAAVDMNDVLRRINTTGDISVEARVSGNHIVLEDQSGGAGNLTVREVNGGSTAADLGILQSVAADAITGSDVVYLTDSTPLSRLNDGNGMRRNAQGDDMRITTAGGESFTVSLTAGALTDATRLDVLNNGQGVRLGVIRLTNRTGATGTVDLSGAQTIGDVKTAIANAVDENTGAALNIRIGSIGVSGVSSLTVTDNSEPAEGEAGDLIIEDVSGYAAQDLGIAKSTADKSYNGKGIHRITTIGDVVRAINFAAGNTGTVAASLTTNGIRLEDTSGGGGALTVEALTDGKGGTSRAAWDLGIEGSFGDQGNAVYSRHLLAGLNTVLLQSLQGGSGVELGQISIATRDGAAPMTVDLAGAQTVQDVLDRINENVAGVRASVNAVGHGIAITDVTGATAGNLQVSDVTGTAAAAFGIAGSVAGTEISGSSAQLRYISELTELEGLNGGRGVHAGTIEFSTTNGDIFEVEIAQGFKTIGKVIDTINEAGQSKGITASINATGDGILITDSNGGSERLTITDRNGGTAAADLRIAGESSAQDPFIDGTFEIRINIDADDTLQDVAAKIRDASPDLNASVLNDGASSSSFRLSVTSGVSGQGGELLFDTGTSGLDMSTLVAAQDAVVLIGGGEATSPIVVSSSTNVLSGVLPGVEIDLLSTSEETVTVSVGQDLERIITDLKNFVKNYNAVVDRIDELTSFDAETQERGVLFADATVSQVEDRLARSVLGRFKNAPVGTETLGAVGITFGNKGHLTFDETEFREKYAADPESVEQFFTRAETGVGPILDGVLEALTEAEGGLIARRSDVLGEQIEDLNERMAVIDDRLATRRAQLERQFANLESVLAGMQNQQSALTQLAALLPR